MTDHWTDRLSDYLDDTLPPDDRRMVTEHLRTCRACAAQLADLERLRARVRTLPDVPPRADLWPGIARRIAAAPRTVRPVPFFRRRLLLSVPQLAAAAAVLVLLGGGAAWGLTSRGPVREPLGPTVPTVMPATFRPVEPSFDNAVRELETILRERRDQLDPRTVTALEESLRTIDRAIGRAQKALADDPQDTYLQHHLAETMQRKLDLLRQVAALTTS